MTAQIRLMVNSGSGVLAAVVNELQALGIRVKTHALDAMSNTSALLTLQAEAAADTDLAELRSRLSGLPVVQRVEDVTFEQRKAPVEKTGIADELVERVSASYPKIMPHVQAYEEELAKDPRRREKLHELGAAVGATLAAQHDDGIPEDRNEVIDTVVVPRLGAIAEASREGEAVVVPISLFTRRMVTSMDLFSGDDENCWFMCGLIEGMIAAAPGQEAVKVEETKCRANGDSACVFVPR